MSESKIREVVIHRSDCDTPVILFDKSDMDQKSFENMFAQVFSSPNISKIVTSSGTVIFKPSKIDMIEIPHRDITDNENKLDIINPKTIETKFVDITKEVKKNNDDEKRELDIDSIDVEKIVINNTSGAKNDE